MHEINTTDLGNVSSGVSGFAALCRDTTLGVDISLDVGTEAAASPEKITSSARWILWEIKETNYISVLTIRVLEGSDSSCLCTPCACWYSSSDTYLHYVPVSSVTFTLFWRTSDFPGCLKQSCSSSSHRQAWCCLCPLRFKNPLFPTEKKS